MSSVGSRINRILWSFWPFSLCGAGAYPPSRPSAPSGAARHEVITLTNISPERGKEFLSRLKIATASKIGTNALLVTGEPSEVQKAVAILNLVDTRTEFDVKDLGPAGAGPVPSSAEIAAAAGVSVGTFAHPPQDKNKARAIVDVSNGTIVAIAPVFQMQAIQHAVELRSEILKQRQALTKATKEPPSSEPPMSREPPVPGAGPSLPLPAAESPQTIAAPAMLGSSLAPETARGDSNVGSTPTKTPQTPSVDPSQDPVPTDALPPKLPDAGAAAAELKAEPKSLTASAAKPEPAAPAEPPATSSKPADKQASAQDRVSGIRRPAGRQTRRGAVECEAGRAGAGGQAQ